MKSNRIDYLIMAGGTGGHIFPALAVAEDLSARGQTLAWLGSNQSMESKLVPSAGIDFFGLTVTGLRGKSKTTLLLAPFRLLLALGQALRLLRRLRPKQVIGFGGFASGPGGLAAKLLGIPLSIHEQNAFPGLTNRKLAGFSQHVFTAFPGAFPGQANAICLGNPVRKELLNLASAEARYQQRSGRLRLLVIGGSLGAQVLNQTLPKALALLAEEQRPLVRHQAGAGKAQATQKDYADCLGADDQAVEVLPFIEDMAASLAWADLVLCRAGALTVSELAVVGVAAVLVPFPHAVDDHQTHNARFLADAGAAVLVPQSELSAEYLAQCLAGDLSQREYLKQMAVKAQQLAKPQATTRLVDYLMKDQ